MNITEPFRSVSFILSLLRSMSSKSGAIPPTVVILGLCVGLMEIRAIIIPEHVTIRKMRDFFFTVRKTPFSGLN